MGIECGDAAACQAMAADLTSLTVSLVVASVVLVILAQTIYFWITASAGRS